MAKRFAAVILGAGSTTIADTPQLMLKVDGTPLIRRTVDAVAKAGVSEIVVTVKSESDPSRRRSRGLRPGSSPFHGTRTGSRRAS